MTGFLSNGFLTESIAKRHIFLSIYWSQMMSYVAPLKDMLFAMNELAGLAAVNGLPGCEDATLETVEAVLEENAKFCAEVVAPLNRAGDLAPSTWHDGQVTTTK